MLHTHPSTHTDKSGSKGYHEGNKKEEEEVEKQCVSCSVISSFANVLSVFTTNKNGFIQERYL
jgi:hypothetical protein